MLADILKYQFLQNAIAASLLASIVCGIIGVIIVQKKLIMMSGGIAHTAYGGVGLGYLLGFEPLLGAVGFSVMASLGLGYIKRRGKENSDVVLAIFWSLGMALGIAFVSMTKGYPPDMSSFLFGNILSVTKSHIGIMTVLSIITVAIIGCFYSHWKSYLFDSQFAEIHGLPVALMEYTLLILIAVTVVILIKVVGIMLIIALLTIPAVTAEMLSKNLFFRMLLAMLFGTVYCLTGLYFSYKFNMPTGAIIIITSVLGYVILSTVKYIVQRLSTNKNNKTVNI